MFSNILNFNPKQKKPAIAGCGPHQLMVDSRQSSPTREEVFMEVPIEPNMGPSLADVLLCTFESTNAGFSSFSVRKLLS
jgi:hypothetical protein